MTSVSAADRRRRVVYVTAGSVGAGHMVRGLALRAALGRACVDIELVMLAPPSPWVGLDAQTTRTYRAEPELWRDPVRADTSDLAQQIRALEPDLLVVDLFWVPLSKMSIDVPIWLLLRSVPPAWLVGPVDARFDAGRYERVLALEPAPVLAAFEQVGPIVLWDDRVAASAGRDQLAEACGARVDEPLRLVMRAGLPDDEPALQVRAQESGGAWRWARLDDEHGLFPISHWLRQLRDGDAVVSGAGYNAFWEAQLLGYGERVHWVALPRRIDDQRWRASLSLRASGLVNGADEVAGLLKARLQRR